MHGLKQDWNSSNCTELLSVCVATRDYALFTTKLIRFFVVACSKLNRHNSGRECNIHALCILRAMSLLFYKYWSGLVGFWSGTVSRFKLNLLLESNHCCVKVKPELLTKVSISSWLYLILEIVSNFHTNYIRNSFFLTCNCFRRKLLLFPWN